MKALGNWTVESVKAELPDVQVSIAGLPREACSVIGRKSKFAGVYCHGGVYEFAWQSIADALNFDRALII